MNVLEELLEQDCKRTILTRQQRRAVQGAARALEHEKIYVIEIAHLRRLAGAAYAGELAAKFDLPDEWAEAFHNASVGMPFKVPGVKP